MLTLQPISAQRSTLLIPAGQIPRFYEETEDARKFVLDWIGILEPLRHAKGRTALFKDVAEALQDRYTRQAQENLEELYLLRAMQPSDFPAEPGEIPADSHRHAVERAEQHHREYVGKGFIDE